MKKYFSKLKDEHRQTILSEFWKTPSRYSSIKKWYKDGLRDSPRCRILHHKIMTEISNGNIKTAFILFKTEMFTSFCEDNRNTSNFGYCWYQNIMYSVYGDKFNIKLFNMLYKRKFGKRTKVTQADIDKVNKEILKEMPLEKQQEENFVFGVNKEGNKEKAYFRKVIRTSKKGNQYEQVLYISQKTGKLIKQPKENDTN